jgi:hypothetical protein
LVFVKGRKEGRKEGRKGMMKGGRKSRRKEGKKGRMKGGRKGRRKEGGRKGGKKGGRKEGGRVEGRKEGRKECYRLRIVDDRVELLPKDLSNVVWEEDRLCSLVVRLPGCKTRGLGLDSRHCQIF